jgi:rare lipoprotein A
MKEGAMAVPKFLPAVIALAALVTGCGSVPQQQHRTNAPLPGTGSPSRIHPKVDPELPVLPPAGSGRGAYYQDDGPADNPPPDLKDVPDAVVKAEPYSKYANRRYVVFGKTYTPIVNDEPFEQRGVATWYGKKFHGQRTSSGELYDMYKMSAAHPTLPIPSYARITSIVSGKQVVVRINDRGPFHSSRIVDVSYTAALKLGLLGKGSHEVVLERLLPGAIEKTADARRTAPAPTASPHPLAAPEIVALMLEDRLPLESDAVATVPAQPEPGPAPQSVSKDGFYLQLGAFRRAEMAAQVRAQLAQLGGGLGPLEVEQVGELHRLFSGPFPTRMEAAQSARNLPVALGLKPIVVKR